MADAFAGRTRVPVRIRSEVIGDQSTEVKIAFYRITQEVFNNIAKHAEATSVDVDLQSSAHKVKISIQDNGIGFNARTDKTTGMGLSIMKERARDVRAQLKIESQIGHGTQVYLSWTDINQDDINE